MTTELKKASTNEAAEGKVNRRTEQTDFRADKPVKRGASIVGIQKSMGVYEIPAGVSSKQETHIPAYERKQIIS